MASSQTSQKGKEWSASTGPEPRGRGWQARRLHKRARSGALQRGLAHVVEDGKLADFTKGQGVERFNGARTTWSRMASSQTSQKGKEWSASTGPSPRGRGWQARRLHKRARSGALQRGQNHVVEDGKLADFTKGQGVERFNGARTTWSRMASSQTSQKGKEWSASTG